MSTSSPPAKRIGQIAGNLIPFGAAAKGNKLENLINKTDDLGILISKADNLDLGKPVTISTPNATTNALDWIKNRLDAGGATVSDEFTPTIRWVGR